MGIPAFAVLRRQHREISLGCERLRLLEDQTDGQPAIHLALLRLRACVNLHLASEGNLLFAVLRHHHDVRIRMLLRPCRDEVRPLSSSFDVFIRHWLEPDAIARFPVAFWCECDRLASALRQRILREEAEIYPRIEECLLDQETPSCP